MYEGLVTHSCMLPALPVLALRSAVESHDESSDPVGACVGLRGSRVQACCGRRLRGEAIDIIPF